MRNSILTLIVVSTVVACSQPTTRSTTTPQSNGIELPVAKWNSVELVPVPEAETFAPARPTRHILTNGMTVLLMPNHELPVVEMELSMRGGSWSDPQNKTGLAEITAAVLRDGGSQEWSGDKLDSHLDFLGASLSFAASDDSTGGSLSCLPEDFASNLAIFEQLIKAPAFPKEKLEMVRGQLLTAVASRNDDAGQAATRESLRAYYGIDDPRIRRMEVATIESISRDDLVEFHNQTYGSWKAMVSVYGDFNPKKVLKDLETRFGSWPVQANKPGEISVDAPERIRSVFVLNRDDVNQAEIRLMHQGIRRSHPDYPALRLGAYIFGVGGFGNRMMAKIRRELGLAYGAGAYWEGSFEQQGMFKAYCATKNETAYQATTEMLLVLQKFLDEGVGQEEFEQAKMRLINAEVFDVDTSHKVLNRVSSLEFYGYPWNFYENASLKIRDLTVDQVVEACRRHLNPAQLSIFIAGNTSQFDGDFSELGELIEWDDSAPAVDQAPKNSADVMQATQLAEDLLSSHGGRKAWESIGAVGAKLNSEGVEFMEAWLIHPADFAERQSKDGKEVLMALRGEHAWELNGNVVTDFNAEEASAMRDGIGDKLPLVLMRLARDEYQLTLASESVLQLSGYGQQLQLEVGDDGLCRKISAASGDYEFRNYALSGAVLLPLQTAWSAGEEKAVLDFTWQINPELPEHYRSGQ